MIEDPSRKLLVPLHQLTERLQILVVCSLTASHEGCIRPHGSLPLSSEYPQNRVHVEPAGPSSLPIPSVARLAVIRRLAHDAGEDRVLVNIPNQREQVRTPLHHL